MDDAVAHFRRASEAADIDRLMDTLAPDVELISPISGRLVFRGQADLRVLLAAVYASLSGLKWGQEYGDGNVRVVLGEASVGRVRLSDAMVVELADDGRIRRITPHLRPWLPLTLLALRLGPKVLRNPGLLRRTIRRV